MLLVSDETSFVSYFGQRCRHIADDYFREVAARQSRQPGRRVPKFRRDMPDRQPLMMRWLCYRTFKELLFRFDFYFASLLFYKKGADAFDDIFDAKDMIL